MTADNSADDTRLIRAHLEQFGQSLPITYEVSNLQLLQAEDLDLQNHTLPGRQRQG